MLPQDSSEKENLRILEGAADAPEAAYANDPDVREAFDAELRQLAEEIVQYHPSLTQLLLAMGDPSANPVHGKN